MASTKSKEFRRHSLQRLQSPGRGFSAIVHILGLCSFAGSYWYLAAFPTIVSTSYGWHWQYLTIIGLTVATASFASALVSDITLSPAFFTIKNTLSLCSAPLEVVISILYWGISAIDRELIVPPTIHIDWRADIGFHLMPAVLLLIDFLLLSPPWAAGVMIPASISFVLAFGYWGWVEHCFTHNGWYPYPLFQVLTTSQRIALFFSAAVLMTGSSLMLAWLYGLINGTQGSEIESTPENIKGTKSQ